MTSEIKRPIFQMPAKPPPCETAKCLFDNFPVELYDGIFNALDIPDLKSCSEVCFLWYSALQRTKSLSSKVIPTWNADSMGLVTFIRRLYEVWMKNLNFSRTELRLRGFGEFEIAMLRAVLPDDLYERIRNLEIAKHDFSVAGNLCKFISKFRNLEKLTLSELTAVDSFIFIPTYKIYESLNNLKCLKLHTTGLVFPTKMIPIALVGQFCQNLRCLSFDMFDCDTFGLFLTRSIAFKAVLQIVRNNAKTLREVTLDTFPVGVIGRSTLFHDFIHELVRLDASRLFQMFVTELSKFSDWGAFGLQLHKLHLRFPLIIIEAEGPGAIFLQFLGTQTSLRRLALSQLYLPTEGSSLQELLKYVPANCYLSAGGVAKFRERSPGPGQFDGDEDWEDEFEDDEGGIVGALFEIPNADADDENDDELNVLLAAAQPLDPEMTDIRCHSDSQVKLRAETMDLTLLFVCCRSIENISFLNDYVRVLTKITIDQVGVALPAKIVIGDVDIQNIIASAKGLTELCLEFCNLEAMTDFGLTGIGPDACRRIALTNDFEIRGSDRFGLPISSLKNLSYLRLSNVGEQITDISAYHAFKGLQSLKTFGIFSPKMTPRGFQKIQDLFRFNQMIKIGPFYKNQPTTCGYSS